MAEDPLAEVLVEFCGGTVYDPGGGYAEERAAEAAAAVRAHIAAVLDAEMRFTTGYATEGARSAARRTVRRLRAALLGTTEEAPGG